MKTFTLRTFQGISFQRMNMNWLGDFSVIANNWSLLSIFISLIVKTPLALFVNSKTASDLPASYPRQFMFLCVNARGLESCNVSLFISETIQIYLLVSWCLLSMPLLIKPFFIFASSCVFVLMRLPNHMLVLVFLSCETSGMLLVPPYQKASNAFFF